MLVSATHRRQYDEDLTSSDSDDYHQAFFSSSSHDRSSVGSIPWAEDAIKQNQQEWERIERMFFGEEELTDEDPELRREIIEWTTAFPHLRIVGRKLRPEDDELRINGETTDRNRSSAEMDEDKLPSIDKRFNKSFIIHPEAKSILLDENLSRILERDLRINSVPMVTKRRQLVDLNGTQQANLAWERPIARTLQPSDPPRKFVKRQTFPSNSYVPSFLGTGNSLIPPVATNFSRSARIVRMPPIVNLILPSQSKYLPSGSATSRVYLSTVDATGTTSKGAPTRLRPIVLPLLKVNRREPEGDVGNRSISAMMNHEKLRAMYLTNSASKLKIPK